MKKLLRVSLLAVFATSIVTPLVAFSDHDKNMEPGEQRMKMIEHLAIDLDLNDEQKTQLNTLFKDMHDKHAALREEKETRLKEILSEEQYEQMKEGNIWHGKPHCKKKPCDDKEKCKMKEHSDSSKSE